MFGIVHVDDCTITSAIEHVKDFKARIRKDFSIKDLGALGLNPDGSPSLLLGMEILRTADEFQLRQTALIDKLIEKVGNELSSVPHEKVPIRDIRLDSSSSPTTPGDIKKMKAKPFRPCLGVCGYLMLASRNEICFAYSQLARFNTTYGKDHWDALLRLIAYLKKTRDSHYLCISKFGGMSLSAFCDSDYNGTEGCLSTTGWIVFFGHTPLSWVARLQRATARSTGESEFLSLSSVAQECVYLQMLVRSLRIPTSVFEIYSNDVSRHAVTEADQSNPIFLHSMQDLERLGSGSSSSQEARPLGCRQAAAYSHRLFLLQVVLPNQQIVASQGGWERQPQRHLYKRLGLAWEDGGESKI